MSRHSRLRGDAEKSEQGYGQILDARVHRLNLSCCEKNAGNVGGIDAVVGDPGVRVVLKRRVGKAADAGFPGRPVTGTVTDNQIGRDARVRPGNICRDDSLNRGAPVCGIAQGEQSRADALDQCPALLPCSERCPGVRGRQG